MEEQLRDRERRAGRLLGQQRVDVLARMPRPRVTVREGGDRDLHALPVVHPRGPGQSRDAVLGVRRALGLHPVDQLHELRRALEVAEERVALIGARGRVAAQREEAGDVGIQEFADQRGRAGVRVADAGDVRERLDVGLARGCSAGRRASDRRWSRPRRRSPR